MSFFLAEVTELSQISHINTQKPHQGGYYTSGDTTHYYSNKTPFTSDASHISTTQVSSIVLLLFLFLNLCNMFTKIYPWHDFPSKRVGSLINNG